MTFLLELRDAAKVQHDLLARKLLRDAADNVEMAVNAVYIQPTTGHMAKLNCEWSRAWRLMEIYSPSPDPTNGGRGMRLKAILAA